MSDPAVSVVIPTKNGAATLVEIFAALRAQSLTPAEVVIRVIFPSAFVKEIFVRHYPFLAAGGVEPLGIAIEPPADFWYPPVSPVRYSLPRLAAPVQRHPRADRGASAAGSDASIAGDSRLCGCWRRAVREGSRAPSELAAAIEAFNCRLGPLVDAVNAAWAAPDEAVIVCRKADRIMETAGGDDTGD